MDSGTELFLSEYAGSLGQLLHLQRGRLPPEEQMVLAAAPTTPPQQNARSTTLLLPPSLLKSA